MKRILFLLILVTQPLFAQRVTIPLDSGWRCHKAGDEQWLDAEVPGTVAGAMIKNGLIGDPYTHSNFDALTRLADGDWEYKIDFDVTSELIGMDRIELSLEGINVPADILLNDSLILSENHPFFIENIDIGNIVRRGVNSLSIILHPLKIDPESMPDGLIHLPRISKAPVIHAWSSARIRELFIDKAVLTDDTAASATLIAHLDLEMTRPVTGQLEVIVDGKTVKAVPAQLPYGRHQTNLVFKMLQFRLWWPNGMGGRKVYNITVRLKDGDSLLDEAVVDAGFKVTEVNRKKDKLLMKVNGLPLKIHGITIGPPGLADPETSMEKYIVLLRDASAAGFNTVYVPPYFFYDEAFYKLCDRFGMLVWQSLVPPDTTDRRLWNISETAVSGRARKLSRHASLGLWLADKSKLRTGTTEKNPLIREVSRIFNNDIPRKGDERWYGIPIVDFHESDTMKNCQFLMPSGEGRPLFTFRENGLKFIGNYGFPSWPGRETIDKIRQQEGASGKPVFQRPPSAGDTIDKYIRTFCPQAGNAKNRVILSQILQGEAVNAVLMWSRTATHAMEKHPFLQFNSPWPGLTCAMVDFEGRRKASYYFAQRALKKMHLAFTAGEDEIRLYLVNDLPKDFKGVLQLEGLGPKGKKLISDEKKVKIKTGEHKMLWHMPRRELQKNTEILMAKLTLEGGKAVIKNLYFVNNCTEAASDKPVIKYDFVEKGSRFFIKVQSNKPARYVHFDAGDLDLLYSDNYFHLAAKDPKLIEVWGKAPFYEIRNKLTVRSLADLLSP